MNRLPKCATREVQIQLWETESCRVLCHQAAGTLCKRGEFRDEAHWPHQKSYKWNIKGVQWVLGDKAFHPWFYSQLKVTGILSDTGSTAGAISYLSYPCPGPSSHACWQWAHRMKHLSGLMVHRPALIWCLWWGHHQTDINPFVLALPDRVFIWIKTFSWPWGFYIYVIPRSLNRYKKCFLSLILLIFFFYFLFWSSFGWLHAESLTHCRI